MKTKNLFLSLTFAAAICTTANAADTPNILLIIADDVASDVLPYGSPLKVKTSTGEKNLPNLDAIAKGGLYFTSAYSEPACTPTRASIYTGLHPHLSGATHPDNHDLPLATNTIAETAPSNYLCGLYGKWHLGDTANPNQGTGWQPQHHGWDDWAGHIGGDPTAGTSGGTYRNWKYWDKPSGQQTYSSSTQTHYASTIHRGNVCSAIQAWAPGGNPWFITYACSLAHDPFHDPQGGQSGPATESEGTQYFEEMVEQLDKEIGTILYYLVANGELDDTVIIFVGDNGTHKTIKAADGTACKKTKLTDRGLRVPLIIAEGSNIEYTGHPRAAVPNGSWVRSSQLSCEEAVNQVHVVDLYATIAELMGATNTTGHQSYSIKNYLATRTAGPTRDHIFSQWGGTNGVKSQSTWIKKVGNVSYRLYHDADNSSANNGYQIFSVNHNDDPENGGQDYYSAEPATWANIFQPIVNKYQQLSNDGLAPQAFPDLPTN